MYSGGMMVAQALLRKGTRRQSFLLQRWRRHDVKKTRAYQMFEQKTEMETRMKLAAAQALQRGRKGVQAWRQERALQMWKDKTEERFRTNELDGLDDALIAYVCTPHTCRILVRTSAGA